MLYYRFQAPGMQADIAKIAMGTTTLVEGKELSLNFEMLDYYLDCGGNCLDTARRYGFGESEKRIGRWMKQRQNRHQIFISTKGAHPIGQDMHVPRLSRADIDQDLEESLTDLGTDYIDLYFLHRDDVNRPVSDIMETLHRHVKSGKIRAIGASNWSVERIEQANRFAKENGMTPFSASQIKWSFSEPLPPSDDTLEIMDQKVYPWYLKEQMPVFAFSSQAKGYFTRRNAYGLDKPVSLGQFSWVSLDTPENRRRAARIDKLSRDLGVSIASLVLAYLTNDPLPTIPIIGCGSMDTLRDSLSQPDLILTDEQLRYLREGE